MTETNETPVCTKKVWTTPEINDQIIKDVTLKTKFGSTAEGKTSGAPS